MDIMTEYRLTTEARKFAIEAHGAQMYGDYPYWVHLLQVATILEMTSGRSRYTVPAAWLHDVLEDTDTSREDLLEYFPEDVVQLVEAVTNDFSIKGRKERHKEVYPRIKALGHDAVILKFADRLANVTASLHNENFDKLKMYVDEWRDFSESFLGHSAHPLFSKIQNKIIHARYILYFREGFGLK